MTPQLRDNIDARWAELPGYLSGHIALVAMALLIGILISIPIGIMASRDPRVKAPFLGAIGVVQTVPSLALLALMVPLLGGTIGFAPALVALTLYSMLPIVRNTITGLDSLDPTLIEAAKSVGMTEWQRLVRVELPLASPVILAGVRTATVWVVGTATLSTPVGAESLGNYIFAGLQTRNWVSVLFGCVSAATLAIALDQGIHWIDRALINRRPRTALVISGVVAGMLVVGMAINMVDLSHREFSSQGFAPAATTSASVGNQINLPLKGHKLTIGAKNFTEQYILANLLEFHLSERGARTNRLDNLGSTIVFDALVSGEVDLYVDYTGTIWATIMKRTESVDRLSMHIQVSDYLLREQSVSVVGRLGFENAYGFAMRRDRAEALGVSSILDLKGALTIASDPEFFARREWKDVKAAYGLEEIRTRSMDSTFMYQAVRDGQVDVITAYTTDGRIAAYDLTILDDPRKSLPPYDAILLASERACGIPGLVEEISVLINMIPPELMREANKRVDLDRQTPEKAAAFLWQSITSRAYAPEATGKTAQSPQSDLDR